MKISIVYEKVDILRLIEKDLREQGVRVKQGTSLAYKGALEVRLSVETVETEASPPIASSPKLTSPTEPITAPAFNGDDADMSSVLKASKRLVRNSDGKVRPLGTRETLEFPEV